MPRSPYSLQTAWINLRRSGFLMSRRAFCSDFTRPMYQMIVRIARSWKNISSCPFQSKIRFSTASLKWLEGTRLGMLAGEDVARQISVRRSNVKHWLELLADLLGEDLYAALFSDP